MATLTKEQIVKNFRAELKTKTINVPDFGGEVLIRELTGSERDHVDAVRIVEKNKAIVLHENYIYAASKGMIDAKGEPLFSYEEIAKAYEKNADAIRFVADQVQDLSELSRAAQEAAGKN